MEIVCKSCNTSHYLSDDKIPLETKIGKCKQCSAPITVLGKNAIDSIDLSQSTPPEPEATKNCDFCGEKILAIAKKCRHCSSMLDGSHAAESQCVAEQNTHPSTEHHIGQEMSNENETSTASLWNPKAAARWSVLFTPAFGAWLHAKNWSVLGDEGKAKQSMYWVYGGIAVLILLILLPEKIGRFRPGLIALPFYFGWYYLLANQQIKHVKEKINDTYQKKGWAKPIGIAVASFFIVVGVAAYFDSDLQQESTLTDVSGVWRADNDGAMVTIKLDGKTKSISVNGKDIPVTVKSYDDENKIITLVINDNPAMILTVRQIFDEDEKFTLNFTLPDGTQDDLSFVRRL